MAGLRPDHPRLATEKDVDARHELHEAGHDDVGRTLW